MRRSGPLQRTAPLERGGPIARSSAPVASRPPRRSSPDRDWRQAREKVEAERVCRVCGRAPGQGGVIRVEAAHVLGREHDRAPDGRKGRGLVVNPDDVVGLCLREDGGCHRDYDDRRLDLLPHLTFVEQARAVSLVGILAALRRTTGGRP